MEEEEGGEEIDAEGEGDDDEDDEERLLATAPARASRKLPAGADPPRLAAARESARSLDFSRSCGSGTAVERFERARRSSSASASRRCC